MASFTFLLKNKKSSECTTHSWAVQRLVPVLAHLQGHLQPQVVVPQPQAVAW